MGKKGAVHHGTKKIGEDEEGKGIKCFGRLFWLSEDRGWQRGGMGGY